MSQYAIKYKPNGKIISVFNTKEAALERSAFISDSNTFGVFEVSIVRDNPTMIAVIINSNKSVLNVFSSMSEVSDDCRTLVSLGVCYYDAIQIKTVGKEIKQPKTEKDEFTLEIV